MCDINQNKILDAAIGMAYLGLRDYGYTYIIVDDCWSLPYERETDDGGRFGITRDSPHFIDGQEHMPWWPPSSRLIPHPERFPKGMEALGRDLHDMGYKFGIYSSAGDLTCAGYPGSLYFEEVDAKTFADWGVDCGVPWLRHHAGRC